MYSWPQLLIDQGCASEKKNQPAMIKPLFSTTRCHRKGPVTLLSLCDWTCFAPRHFLCSVVNITGRLLTQAKWQNHIASDSSFLQWLTQN